MFKYFLITSVIATVTVAELSAQNRDTTIYISAVGGLQFDLVRFQVEPGMEVTVTLANKDDMAHNLIITAPGSRKKVVDAALQLRGDGPKKHFVPDIEEALWFVPVLEPNESRSITFTAPEKEGIYPYVCTLPGHGAIMYGAMYVTSQELPPLGEDSHIPVLRRDEEKDYHSLTSDGPTLYRIFMPDAGPAAIAVHVAENLSYCWDAGLCKLRYAWRGGFIDNTEIWKGHRDAYAEIVGDIFYRDGSDFPLHMDFPGNIPATEFKGYRMIDQLPEFHYRLNNIDVFERIEADQDGRIGMIRTFRIPEAKRDIWFVHDPEDGMKYESTQGEWVDGHLRLRPEEAKSFTIKMVRE